MSDTFGPLERDALRAYSDGRLAALDLRRRLDDATFGDVVILLSREQLPLPRAPVTGREAQLARARAWLFPRHDD